MTFSPSDSVLQSLKNTMLAKGYHVVRYNSRGVGQSTGWPSFTGLQEAKDLQELVQWALKTIPTVNTVVIAVSIRVQSIYRRKAHRLLERGIHMDHS